MIGTIMIPPDTDPRILLVVIVLAVVMSVFFFIEIQKLEDRKDDSDGEDSGT